MEPTASSDSHRLLRPDEVAALLDEIQAMIAAGVPIGIGLRESSPGMSGHLDQVAQRLANRLEQGASISEACNQEPSLPAELKPVLVAGFHCGESSQVLSDISDMTRSLQSLARYLQIGLVYPLIITITALILFAVIASVLLTALLELYSDLVSAPPQWITWMEPIIRSPNMGWAAALVSCFIAIVGFFLIGRTQGHILIVPGLSRIRRDFQLAHFSHLLSLLAGYGVPLPESLRLTGDAVTGPHVANECEQIASSIERGESIDVALSASTHFPEFLKWLIVTGHSDSQLPRALKEAAQFYRRRAENRARWLGKFLPAAAVILVGGGVTFLYVMTVFGPMTDLWTKLAQH